MSGAVRCVERNVTAIVEQQKAKDITAKPLRFPNFHTEVSNHFCTVHLQLRYHNNHATHDQCPFCAFKVRITEHGDRVRDTTMCKEGIRNEYTIWYPCAVPIPITEVSFAVRQQRKC